MAYLPEMLFLILTLLSKLVCSNTPAVEQHRWRIQIIIISRVWVVWPGHWRSILWWQHVVEVRLKKVLVYNRVRLVGVTVAAIAVLHLCYLQDWVVLVELLMVGSTPSTVAAGMDLVVSITLIVSTFSQYNWRLLDHMRVWWPMLWSCGWSL